MGDKAQKTILVTGGAGYIGSAVVARLLEEGNSVVVLDDLSTGDKEVLPDTVVFVQGDVTNKQTVEDLFATHAFDVVIHCAAKKVMSEGEQSPAEYFYTNVFGTLTLLEAMASHNVPKIIFSSTAAVYAPTDTGQAVVETDVTKPASVYGQSKLMAETLIQEFARLKKIDQYIILRYFNVAGDSGLCFSEKHPEGVFPLIAQALVSGSTFYVTGTEYQTKDGSGVRDYIHLDDLVSAHIHATDFDGSAIFNLGTSTGYTVYELLSMFEEVSDKKIEVAEKPPRPGDIAVMVADATLAREKLGWAPTKSLQDMVESTANVYKF